MNGRGEPLTVFTPLPPERNGIADYAALLLPALAAGYDCAAACEDWLAEAPAGVAVLDPGLAHRRIALGGGGSARGGSGKGGSGKGGLGEDGPARGGSGGDGSGGGDPGGGGRDGNQGGRVLHQLGNNAGHGFVLRALRRHPGVTTLHDPGLLHLHETMGEPALAILAAMRDAPAPLAATHSRHFRQDGLRTRADHLLFDLAGEVLARSRAVVVHSRFALGRLRLLHGAAATSHVEVIPHLLPPAAPPGRLAARARLGLAADAFLVLTAGFATAAKRWDWLLPALELALGRGADLHWIHAGAERAEEYPLSARLAERPALAGRARIAGYLEPDALADHLAAADLLVNLRYPSSGESSGSLARGFAAGLCCVVSDTAGYAELPRDAVVHVPLAGAVPALADALHGLSAEPGRAMAIGAAGRRHALAEMALPAVAARYRQVIEDTLARPVAAAPAGPPLAGPLLAEPLLAEPPRLVALEAGAGLSPAMVAAALGRQGGRRRLLLAAPDLAGLAELSIDCPGLLARLLPPHARLDRLRVLEGPPQAGLLLDLDLGWAG